MIKKIFLDRLATYVNGAEIKPTKINYMFGGNGSGKTSLSRLITHPASFVNCKLDWENSAVESYVFNKDFIKKNFSQDKEIPGIFTLGIETVTAQNEIKIAKETVDKKKDKIINITTSLSSQKQNLSDLEKAMSDRCWRLKVKYGDAFKQAFIGSIGSQRLFFEKFQTEISNSSELFDENTLKKKSLQIFNSEVRIYTQLSKLDLTNLVQIETSKLLGENIVGKENIEIDILIKKLNNSDWVKEGLNYVSDSNNLCPFCQQNIEDDLKKKIESFFDETYQRKIGELENYRKIYKLYIENLILSIEETLNQNIEIIDLKILNEKTLLLKEEYSNNLMRIDEKIKSPSKVVTINSLQNTLYEISKIIEEFILLINENNRIVSNIQDERNKLKSNIWRFIVSTESEEYQTFTNKKNGLQKGIESMSKAIEEHQNDIKNLEHLIREKESKITSVSHSVHLMNKILSLYGYKNFKIEEAQQTGLYKILRPDGSEAKETLSEGEYNFVAFLYFYNLLKGSFSKSGISNDKIVVIDDPISSLDSNALFIVSNLTKSIINGSLKNVNRIVQIFLLTHNVYFFKEVTYKGSRESFSKEESFWIIQKVGSESRVIQHENSPIQTTYELLWREITDSLSTNKVTVFNTLRRILEYYFKILGGLDYEKLINEFEGEELLTCRSLISWINDGSHFIQDDLVVTIDLDGIQRYLEVFKLIFTKTGHGAHYDMMMSRCGGKTSFMQGEPIYVEQNQN